MKLTVNNISHIADILAIPFFGLITYYFYKKKKLTDIEFVLLLFNLTCLILDSYFTYSYYNNMSMFVNRVSHFGDILAIPFFGLMIYYFSKTNKNNIEKIFYLYSIIGFILDSYFSYLFLYDNNL